MHGVTRTQNSFKMNVFRVKISKIFPARPNHGGPRGAELKPLFAGSYYTLTVDRACTRVTVSVTVTEQLEHNHKTTIYLTYSFCLKFDVCDIEEH